MLEHAGDEEEHYREGGATGRPCRRAPGYQSSGWCPTELGMVACQFLGWSPSSFRAGARKFLARTPAWSANSSLLSGSRHVLCVAQATVACVATATR